jgi:hypothetical protein
MTQRAWVFVLLFAIFAALIAPLVHLRAAPPTDFERGHSDWFRSLQAPDGSGSCCDLTDCRTVETRINARGNYEALLTPQSHGQVGMFEPAWVEIPMEKTIFTSNPTGKAVACWTAARGVICFVRPLEI